MDMTEKSGQPSMEEILASIRRIIAEEPADAISLDFRPRSGTEPGNGAERLDIEDAGDFELPSMFRATPAAAEKSSAPVKLLDALRSMPQLDETQAARPHHDFPLPQAPAAAVAPAPVAAVEATPVIAMDIVDVLSRLDGLAPVHQALSALKPAQRADPLAPEPQSVAPVAAPFFAAPPAASPFVIPSVQDIMASEATAPAIEAERTVEAVPTGFARQMVAFRDQRFSRISNLTSEPAKTVAPPAPVEIAPIQNIFAAPASPPPLEKVAAPATAPALVPPPLNGAPLNGASMNGSALTMAASNGADIGAAPLHSPLPQGVPPSILAVEKTAAASVAVVADQGAQRAAGPAIEDATAELLRPMLRQWLSENMPRMVEKALHIEVAESVKSGK